MLGLGGSARGAIFVRLNAAFPANSANDMDEDDELQQEVRLQNDCEQLRTDRVGVAAQSCPLV